MDPNEPTFQRSLHHFVIKILIKCTLPQISVHASQYLTKVKNQGNEVILSKLIESIADTEAQTNLIPQVRMPVEDIEDHSINNVQLDPGMVCLNTTQVDLGADNDIEDEDLHDIEEEIRRTEALNKKKLRMQNRSRLPISSFPAPPPRIFAGSVQEPLAKSSQAPIQDLSYRSPSSSQASPEGLAKQSTSSSQSSPQVFASTTPISSMAPSQVLATPSPPFHGWATATPMRTQNPEMQEDIRSITKIFKEQQLESESRPSPSLPGTPLKPTGQDETPIQSYHLRSQTPYTGSTQEAGVYSSVRRDLSKTTGWNETQTFISQVLNSTCQGQKLPPWTASWEITRSTHGSFSKGFNRLAITVALQNLLESINNDPDYFEGIKSGDPESIQTVFSTLLESYDSNVVASLLLTEDFITLLGKLYDIFMQQKKSEANILNISMNNLKFKTKDAIDILRFQNKYQSRDTSRDPRDRPQSREPNRWKTPNENNSSAPPSHYPPSPRPSAGYRNPVPRTQDNRSRTPTRPSFNSGQAPSQPRDGTSPSNGFNRSHSREQPRPMSPRSGDGSLPGKQTGWSPSRPTSATRPYDSTRSRESRPRTPSNPPQVNIPPQSGLRTEVPEICRRCSPGITCANRCKDPPDNNFCAKCLNKGHPDHGCPYYFAIGSCVHCPKHAHITKECQWARHPERFPAALKREEHAPKDKKLQKANF